MWSATKLVRTFYRSLHSSYFPLADSFPKWNSISNQRCVLGTHFLQKPKIFCTRSLNLSHARSKNGDDIQIQDAKAGEIAETICKLVWQNQNSGNHESALDSLVAGDCLSPALVLEVLKKLNNSGTMALLFFRWAEKKNHFEPTVDIYNALIESLGKIKQFKMVWLLVDEMDSRGLLCRPTFALVCRRLARARRVEETLDAFKKMRKKYGLKPELQDYNSLLDTLAKSKQVGIAQYIFDEWKNKKFTPDIITYTILLEGWGQECNLLRLNEVHLEMRGDGLEPDVVSYGILINAYCKARKYDDAIRLYHEMEGKNIKPTPHIYCTLINALGSERRLPEAIRFFELCKVGSYPIEAPTYNALVGAYCWSNRIDDAFRVVEEMRKYNLGPNTRTYDVILHHYVRLHKPNEAYILFQKMSDEESSCKPTLSTYEIMVRMFCNEGRTNMARFIWDQMKARGVLPGVHIFSALINGFCNDDKVDEACDYLQEMMGMGIRPPNSLFNNLKRFLIEKGNEDLVIIISHQIEKLRSTQIVHHRI